MAKYLNESLPIDEREGQIGFNKDGDKMKTFEDPLEAFIFYKEYKELYIKQLANRYKDVLDKIVYEKLMEYKITTNVDFSKIY